MLQFLLVALASVATNAQTAEKTLADHLFEGKTWRNENWDAVVNRFGVCTAFHSISLILLYAVNIFLTVQLIKSNIAAGQLQMDDYLTNKHSY